MTTSSTAERMRADVNAELLYDWATTYARPNQLEPAGKWNTWLLLAGRGFGKTRTAAEWIRSRVERGKARRIALLGRTSSEVRDVMIEGESGLLAVCPPWNKPIYEPSKRRLTWPDGSIATTFTADEPDQLRGPQFDTAWADELASFKHLEAWDNLRFGLRLGKRPRVIVSTTPRPTQIIRDLVADESTHVTRGSTYDNKGNLAEDFLKRIVAKYESTRLGQQELHAEILDDTIGALWKQSLIDEHRVKVAPYMRRVVVAIDPSTTSNEDSDECGMVIAGLGDDGHGYIIEDISELLSPDGWARKAVKAYHKHKADRIVAEANNGGDLVEVTIRAVDRNVSYKKVHASRGKAVRAEPVSALYEQGRIHHVGMHAKLESQMCTWVPGISTKSPDRMDALVWAITELMLGAGMQIDALDLDSGMREAPHRIM